MGRGVVFLIFIATGRAGWSRMAHGTQGTGREKRRRFFSEEGGWEEISGETAGREGEGLGRSCGLV